LKLLSSELDELLAVAAAVLDMSGNLLEGNAGFLRLLAADTKQPIGTQATRFFIQPNFATLLVAANANHEGYRGLITIGDDAGTARTLRGLVWRTDHGMIRILAEYDIAEMERLNEAILELNQESSIVQRSLHQTNITLTQREGRYAVESLTDALTGIGNRRRLDQAMATEVSRARRGEGTLCVIIADIDHFKGINDRYGHVAGDKVLARFGELLRVNSRITDIVVRFGGEEFVVLLPHTNLAQALSKAEQYRIALSAKAIEPLEHTVTLSFGVAEFAHSETGESFLGRADAALYRAKQAGRNRVVAAEAGPLPPTPDWSKIRAGR